MKIDFTKIYSYIKLKKEPIYLFFACLYLPIFFHIGYVVITKEYYFLLYDFIIGLSFFIIYDSVLGSKLYEKKNRQKLPKPKKEPKINILLKIRKVK